MIEQSARISHGAQLLVRSTGGASPPENISHAIALSELTTHRQRCEQREDADSAGLGDFKSAKIWGGAIVGQANI